MFKSKNKLKSNKKFLIVLIIIIFIILIITLKPILIDKSLKKPSSDFEYLIKKNDYLDFTVNYDILLHGSYKAPSVKAPDGRVTLWHEELEKIDSCGIDVRGGLWPKFFIRLENDKWLYDLQEVVEKNYHNFEIHHIGNKEFLEEITSCFLIKGNLNNTIINLEHCYNYNGIMLYQNLSEKAGGAELIATSYKLEID
jgi:hypothetical protein